MVESIEFRGQYATRLRTLSAVRCRDGILFPSLQYVCLWHNADLGLAGKDVRYLPNADLRSLPVRLTA